MRKYVFGLFDDITPLMGGELSDCYYFSRAHSEFEFECNALVDIVAMMHSADRIIFILKSFDKDYEGFDKDGFTYFELFVALRFFRSKVIGPEWIFELDLGGQFFEGIADKLGYLQYSYIANSMTKDFVKYMFTSFDVNHYHIMYKAWLDREEAKITERRKTDAIS